MVHNNKILIILIHGFRKGVKDMQFWKSQLASIENADILTPNLPTTFGSFERCMEVLEDFIQPHNPEKYSAIYIAGHSMGGLLAREYLQRKKFSNAKRLVCVGTPHKGSKLADITLLCPLVGKIWKPLLSLKSSARLKLTTPEIPNLEIGAIVSINNTHWAGKFFLSKNSDGLVESFSAQASDAKATTYVKVPHAHMQYDQTTALLMKKFFTDGKF